MPTAGSGARRAKREAEASHHEAPVRIAAGALFLGQQFPVAVGIQQIYYASRSSAPSRMKAILPLTTVMSTGMSLMVSGATS